MRRFKLPCSLQLSTLVLTTILTACTNTNAPGEPQSPPTSAAPSSTPELAQASNQPAPDKLIRTEPLNPIPIRITLDDLPAPFASNSVSNQPEIAPIPDNPVLQVPAGFEVNVFADNLIRPRWLALTPAGDVLVTERGETRIRLLRDTNGDGVADSVTTFGDRQNGLNQPFGMAFAKGYFFLGNTDAVLRFPYNSQQTQLQGRGEKIADLTAGAGDLPGGGHWTRNVVVSPDQKLYVAIGSYSNVDVEPLPRASVQVMNLDGSDLQTFASGLRNPVGLDFHPVTGELYTTVNERDGLGDDLPPDYLTRLRQGEFYGWPYTYLSPDRLDPRRVQNGSSERPDLAAQTRTPDVLFQAHSAALGLAFYEGQTFPERYRNGAFIAFRGSWNRNEGTGYKLVFVPFNAEGRPAGYYEDFLTGFVLDSSRPSVWGRPVGLLALSDGSLLFTDEGNDRIYRIQYRASP
jgi:glucose/arabinose dehydrogenase